MPKLDSHLPKYAHHWASGQAVVTLNGKDYGLGTYGTRASHLEYDRLTADWLAGRRKVPAGEESTMAKFVVQYLASADQHFGKNGKPTREIVNVKYAMRPLKERY